jgi:hypothetical protein
MNPTSPTPPRPQTLAAALRLAAAELQAQQPPPELLARVKAGLPAQSAVAPSATAAGAAPGRRAWGGWWGAGRTPLAAFAAVLAGTALLLVLRPPAPLAVPEEGQRYGGFVPVAPAERWPRTDTPAWLVSTELQRERLAALGLPYDAGRAGEAVRAELLLHPSGEVLAVRLLN